MQMYVDGVHYLKYIPMDYILQASTPATVVTHDQAEVDSQREIEEFYRLKREQVSTCIPYAAENFDGTDLTT